MGIKDLVRRDKIEALVGAYAFDSLKLSAWFVGKYQNYAMVYLLANESSYAHFFGRLTIKC